MNITTFSFSPLANGEKEFFLDKNESKHITKVLRLNVNDKIIVTNGKGLKVNCIISSINKNKVLLKPISYQFFQKNNKKIILSVSLLKNKSRFEWLIEKATELGVSEIFPLICQRTLKKNFNKERLQKITIAALKQSCRFYLPLLHPPLSFNELIKLNFDKKTKKFLAHNNNNAIKINTITKFDNCLIVIGPEGDFTDKEINEAIKENFKIVSLGNYRLRSETAAISLISFLSFISQ